jgi:hypothetical protein
MIVGSQRREKEEKAPMKADATLWQRIWALMPMVLSVVTLLVGIDFTAGIVVRQSVGAGLVLVILGIIFCINNGRALAHRARTQK